MAATQPPPQPSELMSPDAGDETFRKLLDTAPDAMVNTLNGIGVNPATSSSQNPLSAACALIASN